MAVEFGITRGFLSAQIVYEVAAKLLGMNYRDTIFNEQVVLEAASLADWLPDRWPLAQSLEQLSRSEIALADAGRLALSVIANVFNEVHMPEKRQRLLIHVAERLAARRDGLVLVQALVNVLPKRFGLNVLHLKEASDVLNAWIAEASRRTDCRTHQLLILPPDLGDAASR
jgi:hypothetical protein